MIAYLATTTTRGRLLARQLHGLLPDDRHNERRTLWRKDRPGTPAGFIATRIDHIKGRDLTGIVLLEPVEPTLLAAATACVTRQMADA